ncbi:uncharacterized protein LOC142322876 isoform X2 [Lycorma delicatula]
MPLLKSEGVISENGPDKIEETVCLFLPHFLTDHNTTSEHKPDDSGQLKEDSLYVGDQDISTDPLGTDGINFIKCEDYKIKNEVETEETLVNDDHHQLKLEFEAEIENSFLQTVKAEDNAISDDVTVGGNIEENTLKNCIKCTSLGL